jgi:hypothetical protein
MEAGGASMTAYLFAVLSLAQGASLCAPAPVQFVNASLANVQRKPTTTPRIEVTPMARKPAKWKVIEKARNVHEFRPLETLKHGNEAWILWMSDEHWDHPKCRLDDTFCAMQGKGDPRGDKGSVREEHWGGNYLDLLVKTAADWYAPWKENIALIGLGNHETSVQKHHETCLVERLCQSLRDKGGITHKGGYSGWVRSMLTGNGTRRYSRRSFYHHGFGGGGPVTKGLIDFNRLAEWNDCDDIICGHVHWKTCVPIVRQRLSDASCLSQDEMYFVRCSTYKDEFEDGFAGFHVEKGRGPRPLGGWWQRFTVKGDRLVIEWQEAKA